MLSKLAGQGLALLATQDPVLYTLFEREYSRQSSVLSMVASSSMADPSVLICEGLVAGNVTTEGYPGARYHGGCQYVDEIERLAVDRAKAAFKAQYANVQPHSGSSANQVVMFNLLRPGDTILGLDLDSGGHLTHGSRANVSGKYFNAVGYGMNSRGLLDYGQIRTLALEHRPKLIICGASAYPRTIDFARFREIADEAGAFLLADISHIAGLVVAGVHPSPIDHAHFTTTSTYKQLFGPRGGLILIGKDHDAPAPEGKSNLADMVQRAVFPYFQGTPNLGSIAAKARALEMAMSPGFRATARRIVKCARVLAENLSEYGYTVLTGGTDNHIVLLDVGARGVPGLIAERALEDCGLVVNRNKIPGDKRSAQVASGIRIGTNTLAQRGMGEQEMAECAKLIDKALRSIEIVGSADYYLDPTTREAVLAEVHSLCERFPLPHYPAIPANSAPIPQLV